MTVPSGATPTTATPVQLLARLRSTLPAALGTTMSTSGSSPTPGNDLYEAYIFGLTLEAAQGVGYQIRVMDDRGPATALHLRRSPGRLCTPASTTGQHFTHAVLSVGSRPNLELHTGVYVVGKSKVLHEADVLLLPEVDADRCRQSLVDPPSARARLIIEAKYYTSAVTLATGREFLGLRKDMSAKSMNFVSTIAGASVRALLAATAEVTYDDGVLPNLAGERRLTNYLERILRDWRDSR